MKEAIQPDQFYKAYIVSYNSDNTINRKEGVGILCSFCEVSLFSESMEVILKATKQWEYEEDRGLFICDKCIVEWKINKMEWEEYEKKLYEEGGKNQNHDEK